MNRPALFARRLIAYAIDVGVLFTVLGGGQILLSRATGFPSWDALGRDAIAVAAWVLLTISLPSWVYFVASDCSSGGATLGKRWLGLRVNARDGGSLPLRRSLARNAVKLAPWELAHLGLMLPVPVMASGSPTTWQLRALLLAYAAMMSHIFALAVTRGARSIHDLVVGSEVDCGAGSRANPASTEHRAGRPLIRR